MQVVRNPLAALLVVAVAAGLAVASASAKGPRPGLRHTVKQAAAPSSLDRDRDAERGEGLNTDKPKPLPVDAIESALQAKGSLVNGVLNVEVDRKDIGTVTLASPAGTVPAKPSWEINDTLTFQPLANGKAFFNGDLALKPSELDGVIHAITANNLVFQAEHQHMYDFNPIVWFVHFRGVGDPVQLANEVHAVLKATSVPLPQAPPSNPTTPLDAQRLKTILHGFDVSVGSDGVVTVLVARRNPVLIDGIRVDPAANIATNVIFEPLNASGSDTAVMPDFSLVANEINPVVSTMQSMGWDIGCLYNQETDEHPQLYFSHEFKHGDPYQLAQEVRQGLDHMNMQ